MKDRRLHGRSAFTYTGSVLSRLRRQRSVFLCCLLLFPVHGAASGERESLLTDTRWQVVAIDGSELYPGTSVTLQFDRRDGGGSTGCNEYRFDYSVRGDRITIDGIISTQRACLPEEILEQEARFLEAIRGTQTYRRRGDRLTLYWDQPSGRDSGRDSNWVTTARLEATHR